jgi:hypothetical protein
MITINDIDVTSLVDINSIVTNDTLDETLASGSIVMPISTLSVPYARFSEVNIDGLLYVVAEDNVRVIRKGLNPRYRHEISLIEPTKILQKRVLPNLTVTQPQGDIPNYIYSIHKNINNYVNNTLETLTLTQTSVSQNTSVVDGLTLKNTNQYQVFFNYFITNEQVFEPQAPDDYLDIEFTVFYGATQIDSKTIRVTTSQQKSGGFTTTYTPTVANNDISVKARTLGQHYSNGLIDDVALINELSVNISQLGNESSDYTLEQVVDKVLSFHPSFTLSDSTRTKIAEVKSPEFTFQNYTLYDALREIANYVSAIVYLGEDDFTTIHFYFYDQVLTDTISYVDRETVEYLDQFTDGFEINASNVVRDDTDLYAIIEPTYNGFITVRGATDERAVQITDTNTAIRLQHGIYKPIQVLVKGLAFEMLDGGTPVPFTDTNKLWDITDYVVEQQRYNTFTSQANPNNRGGFKNKSNTVYYTQGDNKIVGLGNRGTFPPAWNTAIEPNYAIVEAILNKAQEENPSYTFQNDYVLNVSIHDLSFRVKHIPYSDVRLTVYKQKGDNIMYFNEQAPINDMELLGRIAQDNVTRAGNRVKRYQGLTDSNQLLLGSKQNDEVLVNYTISRTPTINKFTAEYAIGYSNISDYVGIDSRYRQYEVPVDTIVNRRDKLTTFFEMKVSGIVPTVTRPTYITSDGFYSGLFANFKTTPLGSRPSYARLDFDGKVVESTIDAYRMGKTLGLAIDMFDNYSAGIKKTDETVYDGSSGLNIKVQEDARYTDDLGRANNVEIGLFSVSTYTDGDNYPDNDNEPTSGDIMLYSYNVNKDARERYGFVWELVFLDDVFGDIKVYDGFVKYNRLASELSPTAVEFRFLEAGYVPQRSFDITRTTLGTGTLNVTGRYAQVKATAPAGSYEGLVLTINEEPIIAILDSNYNFGLEVTRYVYVEEQT